MHTGRHILAPVHIHAYTLVHMHAYIFHADACACIHVYTMMHMHAYIVQAAAVNMTLMELCLNCNALGAEGAVSVCV